MARWFVRVLCGSLLPLALVATATEARADNFLGVSAPVTVHFVKAGPATNDDIGFQVTARSRLSEAGVYSVKFVVKAIAQPLAPKETNRYFVVKGDGAGCSFSSPPAAPVNGNVAHTIILTPNAGTPLAGCVLTTGELHATGPSGLSVAVHPVKTFPLALGALPAGNGGANVYTDPGTCPIFKLNKVPVNLGFAREAYPAGFGTFSGVLHYRVKLALDHQVKALTSGYTWSYVIAYRDEAGVLRSGSPFKAAENSSANAGKGNVSGATLPATPSKTYDVINGGATADPAGWTFVGVQYYAGSSTSTPYPGPTTSSNFNNAVFATPANPHGIGATNPAQCRYWFGPKIYDDTATTLDEPAGTTSDTPTGAAAPEPTDPDPSDVTDEESAECEGFSVTDPTSWAGAGLCQLVKAANAILGTLEGMVTAIGDLLYTLFVPDPASWDVGDLISQWNARPPGSIVNLVVGGITKVTYAYTRANEGDCSGVSFGGSNGNGIGANVGCAPSEGPGGAAYQGAYILVRWGLLVVTSIYLFHILRSALSKGD